MMKHCFRISLIQLEMKISQFIYQNQGKLPEKKKKPNEKRAGASKKKKQKKKKASARAKAKANVKTVMEGWRKWK